MDREKFRQILIPILVGIVNEAYQQWKEELGDVESTAEDFKSYLIKKIEE